MLTPALARVLIHGEAGKEGWQGQLRSGPGVHTSLVPHLSVPALAGGRGRGRSQSSDQEGLMF